MRKRNNFISVFTMFLAIGFAIIFSRPVKATANGVQLKANRTYTAYDVTGDGTKDKIRIRASNQTDDEAYSSLTVSVNGKTAYRLKNTRFYNVIANIYTLKNGQPFLYLSVITILFPFKLVTSPMRWFPYPAIISVKSRIFLNFRMP